MNAPAPKRLTNDRLRVIQTGPQSFDVRDLLGHIAAQDVRIAELERELAGARVQALEEAAQLCMAVKNADYSKLPDYENEPDFADDTTTSEDVCAFHIRCAKERAKP